ncbi:MAG: bifunctional methionine sulfoxide reductase B/A protein [Candidatus Fermentibacteraceae bacterium]
MRNGTTAASLMVILGVLGLLARSGNGDDMGYRQLDPEEELVILHAGTERPFSGEYVNHFEPGTYHCKRCDAALFESVDKFPTTCGWPSFDGEIPGAVTRRPDPDGMRTEIICAACGAHLGHVFEGEGLTPANVRHCVNSISLVFKPLVQTETAVFAGGCFWGIENYFSNLGGVVRATSGYTGGYMESPTYREVCSGETGHAEAVEVVFDPSVIPFEELARHFFEIHDPTTPNRQGVDVGNQYRSAVFYTSEQQRETVERLMGILRNRGFDVVTDVRPLDVFWPAEDYHQDYYGKNGGRSFCHTRVNRFE